MSERGDFFASGAKASKAPSRGAFFAGEPIDLPKQERKDDRIIKGHGKGYMDAEAMRKADPQAAIEAIPTGFNQGVAYLMGLPMDALLNASNLASAGLGFAQSKITGEAPSPFFNPVDPADIPLTGAFNENALNSTPMGDVTHNRNPNDPTARIVQAAASGIPGGLIGGGPLAPNLAAGVAGSGAAGIMGELGADPATQAVASLLAGAGAARLTAPSPNASPLEPITDSPDQLHARESGPDGESAQATLNRQASGQSMGAAGAAVDLNTLSPKLRANVEKAVADMGGNLSPEHVSAIARYKRAESLPVPVYLTEGQVLADGRLISLERNARGKHEGYTKGFNAQDTALTENLRVMRDETGPDVFSTNAAEHGDTIIARYQAIDDAAQTQIGTKYKALQDAAGGVFPVDTPTLLTNVRGALKKDLATSKAPSDVMALLEERAAAGSMTLEDFESLRTSLARTQRSASDGQERHAAGVIRRQIEEMPLQPEAAHLKGLADAARSAARERFQALEADPAYKAAVNEKVAPDNFVKKFVIGGTRDNVARLSAAMADDATAAQTVKVATIEHLRDAARIDRDYKGNFAQSGYNKALSALEPKLQSLLDPKNVETVRELGSVAFDATNQPAGSFVNNSNTLVGVMAEKGMDALEGLINYKAGGIPIASPVREALNKQKVEKAAEKTFEPGAGLTRLSELTKIKKKK